MDDPVLVRVMLKTKDRILRHTGEGDALYVIIQDGGPDIAPYQNGDRI